VTHIQEPTAVTNLITLEKLMANGTCDLNCDLLQHLDSGGDLTKTIEFYTEAKF
jgi:hypothetical protein